MKLKLTRRFTLYIGSILLFGILALIYFDVRSNEHLLREIGLSEAGRLSKAVFDQLYTSMTLGGGRGENKAIIKRFEEVQGIEEVRVIHGPPLDRQYGIEEDELPRDALDREALEGTAASAIERAEGGYMVARVVTPVVVKEECRRCHIALAGQVNGAISVRVSLKNYESVIRGHTISFFYWGGGILAITSIAILLTMHKRLLEPLERIKKAASALASGDLEYRVGISSGDELEELGRAFDDMAESLSAATERLKYLSEKHSKLVNMAADAIILKDLATKMIVEANPTAEVLTGYSREELLSMHSEALYPQDMLGAYREVFRRWAYDGKGYLHDAAIVKKDGFIVPVEIAASVLELGGRHYIQEIWRDITERKGFIDTAKRHVAELEETVRERTFELNRSLKELEEAYGKLKDSEQRLIQSAKLISLGEMGAGIAHELNSPLAGILSITEVLLNRIDPKNPNYFLLQKIKDAVVRSKYIIVDMLTYSRPARAEFTPVFLNEIVKATLSLFSSEIKTSSIELAEDYEKDLPAVRGNKGQLMEVMLNIIKNARDAMGGSGMISVATRSEKDPTGEYSVVEICDTGPGIPQEIMDKIFDPFFTTKEKGGGVNIGLGLSISQSIVKEHGGRIEVENVSPRGAFFRVFLPVYKA